MKFGIVFAPWLSKFKFHRILYILWPQLIPVVGHVVTVCNSHKGRLKSDYKYNQILVEMFTLFVLFKVQVMLFHWYVCISVFAFE